jgi:uncharacterized protein YdaU (DUF1376 family)
MKYEPSPWFRFFPQDFLGGTGDFTCEEVGIYIRLLSYQWIKGVAADRADVLAGKFQNPKSLSTVLKKFHKTGDLLFNERLESERREKEDYSKKQSTNALMRWHPSGIRLGYAKPHAKPHAKTCLSQSHSHLIDQTRARARGRLIDNKKMNPTFTALKLANRIISNETGWHYDNCKVDQARLKSTSLQTVILPFLARRSEAETAGDDLTEAQILSCWANAVRLAHAAKVDRLARNATAYAVECFKQQLQQKGKP